MLLLYNLFLRHTMSCQSPTNSRYCTLSNLFHLCKYRNVKGSFDMYCLMSSNKLMQLLSNQFLRHTMSCQSPTNSRYCKQSNLFHLCKHCNVKGNFDMYCLMSSNKLMLLLNNLS